MEERVSQADASPCCEAAASVTRLEGELCSASTRYVRLAADIDNMRKRHEREREAATKVALESFFTDLLPFMDGLERAEPDPEGLALLKRQFLSIARKHGLEPLESMGQAFDPHQHEAVKMVAADDLPAGTVCEEFARGYRLNGRLLRPSMVAVAGRENEATGS